MNLHRLIYYTIYLNCAGWGIVSEETGCFLKYSCTMRTSLIFCIIVGEGEEEPQTSSILHAVNITLQSRKSCDFVYSRQTGVLDRSRVFILKRIIWCTFG
jgi:hypothetical protein